MRCHRLLANLGEDSYQALECFGIEREVRAGFSAHHRLIQSFFPLRRKRENRDLVLIVQKRLADRTIQRCARHFGQRDVVFSLRAVVGQCFENRDKVANGNFLTQQVL